MQAKKISFKGRSLITLDELTPEEIHYILDLAADLKAKKKKGIPTNSILADKNICLVFEEKSTRTRCGFEIGAKELGMGVTYLTGSQMGEKESIKDTARVLGRMYEGIVYRGRNHEVLEELAKYSGVPVWNGLTRKCHPTPVLGSALTIRNYFGHLKGLKVAWLGLYGADIYNSLMVLCAKTGMHFATVGPVDKYYDSWDLFHKCEEFCKESGGSLTLYSDVIEGCRNADVIYTDIWVNDNIIFDENEEDYNKKIFKHMQKYKVTKEVMSYANPNAIFVHCLPSFHSTDTLVGKKLLETFGLVDFEVSNEVIEGPQSKVFDVSEDMYHVMKAFLYASLVE